MIASPVSALVLIAIGGVLALDATSLGQFMVSRPLIAATLGGWVAGSPEQGAVLGLVLEALHLSVLPVGASRYPEAGPAALVGGAAFAWRGGGMADLPALLLFCLAWEWLGGVSVQWLRRGNERYAVAADVAELSGARLGRLHLGAMAADFARGCVSALLALVLLFALRGLVPGALLPADVAEPLVGLVTAAGAAAVLRLFGERRAAWALLGAAAGVVFVLLR